MTAERDWLRARVEELTALLNREQEAVLRLAAGQRLSIGPPVDTQATTQSEQPTGAENAAAAPQTYFMKYWQCRGRKVTGKRPTRLGQPSRREVKRLARLQCVWHTARMNRPPYPTDLTDAQWATLAPLLPAAP